MEDAMEIEGERNKRFHVYRVDSKGDTYECLGEYDTIAEVRGHRWRMDYRYKIRVRGKYLTRTEFEKWAETNET
jgi:hypothetical protein